MFDCCDSDAVFVADAGTHSGVDDVFVTRGNIGVLTGDVRAVENDARIDVGRFQDH